MYFLLYICLTALVTLQITILYSHRTLSDKYIMMSMMHCYRLNYLTIYKVAKISSKLNTNSNYDNAKIKEYRVGVLFV